MANNDDIPSTANAPRLGNPGSITPGLGGELGATRLIPGLEDPRRRPELIKRLVEIGSPAINPLVDVLSHRNRHVRDAAAYTLGCIGDRRAVPHLITALQDSEPDVRKIAAYALGKLEDVRAIPALLFMLRDRNDQVVAAATHALSRIDLPAELTTVIQNWE